MAVHYRLFAYGSLQIPEVLLAVTGACFPARPARLPGYASYRLVGRPYPGLRRAPGASTEGVLYTHVSAAALRRLDRFEDDFYRRETLLVSIGFGRTVHAEVYVIPSRYHARLSGQPWDLEEFRRTALRELLARLRRSAVPIQNR